MKSIAMRTAVASVVAAALGLMVASPASASLLPFAHFQQHTPNGTDNLNLVWVGVAGAGGTLSTATAYDLVDFTYDSYPGSLASLVGVQAAKMTLNATTTEIVSKGSGYIFQAFDNTITITFTLVTPVVVLGTSLSNLLTVTISPNPDPSFDLATLAGPKNSSNTAILADSANQIITYASDFLRFDHTSRRTLDFDLTVVSPPLAIVGSGANAALRDFRADVHGTFDSDPAPTPTPIPEPVSLLILAAGLGGMAVGRRRV